MKIRQASDIHTEFMAREQHKIGKIVEHDILPPLETDPETTLILAGDIGSMHKPKCLEEFFKHVAPRFKHVLYIPGNHEGYGGDMLTMKGEIRKITDEFPNVHFSDKLLMVLDGITFAGCTLWTDYDYDDECLKQHPCIEYARMCMNDYRLIDMGERKFQPEDARAMHWDHVKFLEGIAPEKVDVVFTHHAPSFKSVNKKFKGDLLNGAYASHLEDLITDMDPTYWFHGHMHNGIVYNVNHTQVICNPAGYRGEMGKDGYEPLRVIEI